MEKSYAEQARDLQDNGARVTLDGKPARVSGFKLALATVWDLADQSRSVEYAWETVVRVLKKNGNFSGR